MSKTEFDIYRPEYEKRLKEIIADTWHFDRLTGRRGALALAGLFLCISLSGCGMCTVALCGGRPAGLIAGRRKDAAGSIYFRLKSLWYRLVLLADGSAGAAKAMSRVGQLDKELAAGLPADSVELTLFVTDSRYRGQGVGSRLFDRFVRYADSLSGAFHLFTDTTCDYGFYLKRGMKNRAQTHRVMQINGRTADCEYFLFTGGKNRI